MTPAFREPLGARLRAFLGLRLSKIRAINEQYKTPRIKTSGLVSMALLALRIYLFLLLGILAFKFFTLL